MWDFLQPQTEFKSIKACSMRRLKKAWASWLAGGLAQHQVRPALLCDVEACMRSSVVSMCLRRSCLLTFLLSALGCCFIGMSAMRLVGATRGHRPQSTVHCKHLPQYWLLPWAALNSQRGTVLQCPCYGMSRALCC